MRKCALQPLLRCVPLLGLAVAFLSRDAFCEPREPQSSPDLPGGTAHSPPTLSEWDRWGIEGAFGFLGGREYEWVDDARRSSPDPVGSWRASIAVTRRFFPHVSLVASFATLHSEDYARPYFDSSETDRLTLSSQALVPSVRFDTDIATGKASVFAQFGAGLALGQATGPGAGSSSGSYTGALGAIAAGALVNVAPHVNILFQVGYESGAPFGKTYDVEVGGGSAMLGLRFGGASGT